MTTAREREDEARWGMHYAPDPDQRGPLELAREAHMRGDAMFQVDLPISWVQGVTAIEAAATRVVRPARRDTLGEIEAVGWQLAHVSTVFVHNGSAATAVNTGTYKTETHATNGVVLGVYVFRRA